MTTFKMISRLVGLVVGTLLATTPPALAANLVSNGSFESGNNGFTSDYFYVPGGNSAEGQYTVASNPFPWNGAFISTGDHTSGSGSMMVANGSPDSGAVVWSSQPIAVISGTNYFFEAFVNNVCCAPNTYFGPNSPSILDFSLSLDGGAAFSLGTITTDYDLAGTWEGLSEQYLSNADGFVKLSLINRNTNAGGNDFAIDDIYFGTQSTVNPPTTVPEPLTLSLLALGLLGIGLSRRKKV